MRALFEDADYRITSWLTHTNKGVITGVLICFALVVLISALLG